MLNSLRREQICKMVNENGAVRIKELLKAFPNVTSMTIHRDLEFLEQIGAIIRIRGGALSVTNSIEPIFEVRKLTNSSEKAIIAEKAIKLIGQNQTVFFDAGTTSTAVAKLVKDINIKVYTTAPNIAIELSHLPTPEINICGGKINRANLALSGETAVHMLENVDIDIAFIGVSGYSDDIGFSCGIKSESIIKSLVVNKAKVTVALFDSSKLNTKFAYPFAQLSDFTYIVDDGKLSDEFKNNAEKCDAIIL